MLEVIERLLFHHAQNKTLSNIEDIFHPELVVEKNNDVYDFEKFMEYGKAFTSSDKAITIKNFQTLIQGDDAIAVKFILEKRAGESIDSEKYLSIFRFKEGRIVGIEEMCIKV